MRTQNPKFELPMPEQEDLSRVEPLLNLIETEINNNHGHLAFDRFMELALYTPALGYYTARNAIFGNRGDFITAPELTPLFSRSIARQVRQVLTGLDSPGDVLEFGAGAGTMATDILLELEKLECLPSHYYIVEISSVLQERQRQRIATYAPHLLTIVQWVKEVPEQFVGIIIGNEIVDAFPVHRVRINPDGQHQEIYVTVEDNRFVWLPGEFSHPLLAHYCQQIYEHYGSQFSGAYDTEINLYAGKWIEKIASEMKQGVVILIDYGFSDKEFYRPERHDGTLMCHYRHLAHSDPLIHVGLQDITTHVNFTQLAEAGFDAGLSVLGFTSQTYFLISCGLESLLSEIDIGDTAQFLKETQPIKQLILPDEMGDLFKAIAFGKNIELVPLGFVMNNQLGRL